MASHARDEREEVGNGLSKVDRGTEEQRFPCLLCCSWLSKIVRAEDVGIASMVVVAKTTRHQKTIQRTRYFRDDIWTQLDRTFSTCNSFCERQPEKHRK